MLLHCPRLSSLRSSSQPLLVYTLRLLSCSSRNGSPLCDSGSACRAAHFRLECKLLELKPLPVRRWKRQLPLPLPWQALLLPPTGSLHP